MKKGNIKHAQGRLSATARDIEEFLDKPLNAIKKKQKFDKKWKASGPWAKK